MNLILLGPPGSGKGTQCKEISKIYNISHISTGDMLRLEMVKKSKIGSEILDLMNKGEFVPNEAIWLLLKEKLLSDECKNGFVLDGFPRNVEQAVLLNDADIKIDKVISIEVPDEDAVGRILNRFVCKGCAAVYNKFHNKPKVDGICDICATNLYIRQDDEVKTVTNRLRIYHDFTEPVKQYYDKMNLLKKVDGTCDIYITTKNIVDALGSV